MKQLTIPFKKKKVKVPVIECCCEGFYIQAIVDTGSESNVFDESFLKDNNLVGEDGEEMDLVSLSGAGNKHIVYTVESSLLFDVDNRSQEFTITGISADLSGINDHLRMKYKETKPISLIIGNDFLKQYSAKINYKTKELTLYYDISGE